MYKFVWANQWEPGKSTQHAFDCYVKHFGESECHVNEDIAKVIEQVPDHDLLVGGFPCQDYSVAGTKAKGIQGKKGVLWWEIDKIVAKKSPKYILLENVDRLLKSPSSQRGRDFAIILKCLAEKGYNVDWMMINAADYGHVQRRRRVFIFAHKPRKNETCELFKDNFFTKTFSADAKGKTMEVDLNKYADIVNVSDKYNQGKFLNIGKMVDGKVVMADYIPTYQAEKKVLKYVIEKKVDEKFYLKENQIVLAEKTKQSKKKERVTADGFKYNYAEGAMLFPDSIDRPARTMLTSETTINRSTHYIGDEKGIRILTPVEAERINGFPDAWTDTGMPEKFRYFCMGNALVVNLIEQMGDMLSDYAKEEL